MYAIVFVSAWQGAGYQIFVIPWRMQNIPQDIYEAAELDLVFQNGLNLDIS